MASKRREKRNASTRLRKEKVISGQRYAEPQVQRYAIASSLTIRKHCVLIRWPKLDSSAERRRRFKNSQRTRAAAH